MTWHLSKVICSDGFFILVLQLESSIPSIFFQKNLNKYIRCIQIWIKMYSNHGYELNEPKFVFRN